jgi:hypothetical protein
MALEHFLRLFVIKSAHFNNIEGTGEVAVITQMSDTGHRHDEQS